MSNFNICVVDLGFTAILGDPKFGAIHVGSPNCVALVAYTWLTLVINCNNEVCSPSNNAVSRAFWQKKVWSLQKDVTLRVISKRNFPCRHNECNFFQTPPSSSRITFPFVSVRCEQSNKSATLPGHLLGRLVNCTRAVATVQSGALCSVRLMSGVSCPVCVF